MKTKVIERNELIATRVPPGDRWTLVDDSKKIIHKSLTDALEAYLNSTGFKGEYRLAPLDSKLYAIKTSKEEVKPEPVKKYNIYGDEY
jgi:lipid A disaccharide synthetase